MQDNLLSRSSHIQSIYSVYTVYIYTLYIIQASTKKLLQELGCHLNILGGAFRELQQTKGHRLDFKERPHVHPLHSKVTLASLTCQHFSTTSPYQSGGWAETARTEQITDSLNPRWQTKFQMDYKFEERQMLRLAIYDIDSDSHRDLDDHDSLGHIDCSLGEVNPIKILILCS